MSERKTTRYLKYALGEIALVMIGILLALQVNNWNENRKNKAFEIKMLKEVRNALKGDIDFIKNNTVFRMQRLDSVLNVATTYSKQQLSIDDPAVTRKFLGRLEYGAVLSFNRGPYEALKSAGINRITNDSLRNHLIKYYDFELPFWYKIISEYTDTYKGDLQLLYNLLAAPTVYETSNGDRMQRNYPKDLLKQDGFKMFVWKSKLRSRGSLSAIKAFQPKMEEVLKAINKELSKN